MTLYFCTDVGQHKRTRLGRFTPEHVKQLDAARVNGGAGRCIYVRRCAC